MSLTNFKRYDIISYKIKMSLSSKWLGHFPFKEETRVQVPLGLPIKWTMELNIFVQHHNSIVHMATEILVSSD